MPCHQQSRHPVERRPEIVVVASLGRARLERHPHPQRSDLAPRLDAERPLGGKGGDEGILPGSEGGAEGIADRLEDVATMSDDRLT